MVLSVFMTAQYAITAAIMHYKEAGIVLEVMDVDLQISRSDCSLHAVATVYELCAGNDHMINFAHTFRDAYRERSNQAIPKERSET